MGRTGVVARIAFLVTVLVLFQGCAGVLEVTSKIAEKSALHKEWKKERITRKGIKTMQERFVFDQKGKKAYMPSIYGMKDFVDHIFAVLVKNAVGTNDLDNAISLIKFKEKDNEVDYEMVKRDFLEEVNGEYEFGFSPCYSDEEIAYTQSKWFVFANIKTKHVISPEPIITNLDDWIRSFAVLDSKNRLFCIERIKPAINDWKKVLDIYQIKGEAQEKKGELPAGFYAYAPGYNQPWLVHKGLVFTYDSAANKILCHDSNLKLATYPFSDIFNRNNEKFRKLKEFKIHPTLPFGLVVEIGNDIDKSKIKDIPKGRAYIRALDSIYEQSDIHTLYLLRWDTPDEKKQFMPLHTDTVSLIPSIDAKQYSDFQFSPDGKWLVFRDETSDRENPCFIALPVDEKKPSFFGEPLYLGKVLREGGKPRTTAWVSDPLSFVVCDGLALYKWELGTINQARIIKSDKDVVPLK